MLKVSRMPSGEPEIFCSVQGEGVSLGTPSVFLRLATCNLQCTWCDTKYTWDWSHYDIHREVVALTCEDLVDRIEQTGMRNVVITGGEPLLQAAALIPVAQRLKRGGHRLEVETNGTVRPPEELALAIDQWNVSPKLAHSGNEPEKREIPNALTWFAACPTASFKFVVHQPADLGEVENLCARFGVPAESVMLMPEATDVTTLAKRSAWLVEVCTRRGYRFGTRLHILLWGDERGR